jgi:hypothetical protein
MRPKNLTFKVKFSIKFFKSYSFFLKKLEFFCQILAAHGRNAALSRPPRNEEGWNAAPRRFKYNRSSFAARKCSSRAIH